MYNIKNSKELARLINYTNLNNIISEEEMKEMLEKIEELERELAEETMSELQDIISCASGDMSEEEIDELKRKHRNEEDRGYNRFVLCDNNRFSDNAVLRNSDQVQQPRTRDIRAGEGVSSQ